MIRPLVLLGVSLGLWTGSTVAGDIYRCAMPAGVVYQDAPCAKPQDGVRMDAARLAAAGVATSHDDAAQQPRASSSSDVPACNARAASRARTLWRRTALCIGMTDDEVLNLKGWGRPTKIVRTRVPREWREEWTYETPTTAPRALHFVNGALVIVDAGRARDRGPDDAPQFVTVSSAAPLSIPAAAPTRFAGSFDAAQTP